MSSRRSPASSVSSSRRSRARSACSVSACELTETYSPAAIDIAPATAPAMPAVSKLAWLASAAATPTTRLAVETIPSFAPRTAARNQPTRRLRWRSRCRWIMSIVYRPTPAKSATVDSTTITITAQRTKSAPRVIAKCAATHAPAACPTPSSKPSIHCTWPFTTNTTSAAAVNTSTIRFFIALAPTKLRLAPSDVRRNPALGLEQHDGEQHEHQHADHAAQQGLVEIDGELGADHGADDGGQHELPRAREVERAALAERSNGDYVLQQHADAVRAVRDVRGQPEEDQNRQREQRAAARE